MVRSPSRSWPTGLLVHPERTQGAASGRDLGSGGAVKFLDRQLAGGGIGRDRILAAEACVAVLVRLALAAEQALEREVANRIGAEVVADLLGTLLGADQLAPAPR